MPLTITQVMPAVNLGGIGNKSMTLVDVDFDNSYPTGGEALTPGNVGLSTFDIVINTGSDTGYVFEFNHASNLLLAYWQDADAIADSALVQVANTTDLSGVTNVRLLCIGNS